MSLASMFAGILRSRAAERGALAPPPLPARLAGAVVAPAEHAEEKVSEKAARAPGGGIDCLGCVYGIMYRDIGDKVGWRRITVRGLTRDYETTGEVLLRAYCHERHAPLHFRSGRIQEMVDLATGETIAEPRAFFARYLSEDPTFRAIRHSGPALQVLAFIARCDGHELPSERALMIDYVRRTCPDLDIDAGLLERHIRALLPDEETFQAGIAALEAMPASEAAALVECAIGIVEADGVLGEDERKWLDEIKGALR